MSLRSYINHHLRQSTLYCWVASIAGIVAVFTAGRRDVFTVALVVCVMLYAVAYYYTFSTRCPRCGARYFLRSVVSAFTFGCRRGSSPVHHAVFHSRRNEMSPPRPNPKGVNGKF
jgi:hypothetical protein